MTVAVWLGVAVLVAGPGVKVIVNVCVAKTTGVQVGETVAVNDG